MDEKLLEIADTLGDAYQERGVVLACEYNVKTDVKTREIELTPTGDDYKALGKNEADRKNALEQVFAQDGVLNQLNAQLDKYKVQLISLTERINGLEAERRAIEWSIRAAMVDALNANHIQANGRGDRASDHRAFDDAMVSEYDGCMDSGLYF